MASTECAASGSSVSYRCCWVPVRCPLCSELPGTLTQRHYWTLCLDSAAPGKFASYLCVGGANRLRVLNVRFGNIAQLALEKVVRLSCSDCGVEGNPQGQRASVWIIACYFFGCVVLNKFLNLSEPCFCHLWNGSLPHMLTGTIQCADICKVTGTTLTLEHRGLG